MTEGENLVHELEYYRVLQHPIIIQLSQILDFRDAPLIKSEIVLL